MEVDLYALCPCGSGKKIKFCKCHDTIADFDKIVRMVEGGQFVAALDRTNQALAEHPDAAWALATKGRLLLRLRETDKLLETADRFLRLQPSNPLALLLRAAADVGKGNIPKAIEYVLQALAESKETHEALLFDVATGIGAQLLEAQNAYSGRVYLAIASMADVEISDVAGQILGEFSGERGINMLLKHLPDLIDPPANAPWLERIEEAGRLLEVNSVILAESKYQALDRQFPGQPAILSGLLRCAIWRGDQAEQAKVLGRLAEATSLSDEARDYYRAMSYLTEPGQTKLSENAQDLHWELNDFDATLAGLQADARLLPLAPEMVRDIVYSEDAVPPRAGFQILDRPKPENIETLPPVEDLPEVQGLILLYGRQTDRPAEVVAMSVLERHVPAVQKLLSSASGGAIGEPKQVATHPAPFISLLKPTFPALRIKRLMPADYTDYQRKISAFRVIRNVLSVRLNLFDGKSIEEVANDAQYKSRLSALVRIIEGYDEFLSGAENELNELRQRLGVATLPEIDVAGRNVLATPIYKMYRVRVDSLAANDTYVMLEQARYSASNLAAKRLSHHLLGLALGKDLLPTKILAYLSLAEATTKVGEALEWIEKGKKWAKENELPVPAFYLSEFNLRVAMADIAGVQRCIQTIMSEFRNDPNVMAQLQQLLVMHGFLNPDGSPRRAAMGDGPAAAAPAPASSSKLWTPDAPEASGKSAGASKLWVPGMD